MSDYIGRLHEPVLLGLARDLLPEQVDKLIENAKTDDLRARYKHVKELQEKLNTEMSS